MKKIIYVLFLLLLISVMLISSIFIYNEVKEDNKQEKIFEELSNIIETKEETSTKQENVEDEINIEELYNINNDLVGWLKIENTSIDYPVMQTKNRPNYYLRRNFYKEYSIMGTPYIAEQCDLNKSDNLIIYGHHINGNKMFGELEKYKKEAFYKNNSIIKFYTKDEIQEYKIISVFKTVAHTGFEYYKYYNFKNESEFNTFIEKCKKLAFYNIEDTASYGDKLITLSTCEYSQENGRLVVIAKKI